MAHTSAVKAVFFFHFLRAHIYVPLKQSNFQTNPSRGFSMEADRYLHLIHTASLLTRAME
jgi:hypothetical protein